MAYQSIGARINRRRRRKQAALAGLFDEVLDRFEQYKSGECMTSANATVAQLDAKTEDLAKNWRPSGFYSVDQVRQLVAWTNAVLAQAQSTVTSGISAQPAGSGAIAPLREMLLSINRKMAEGTVFVNAANTAAAQGIRVIDAPGLKNWVTFSMSHASAGVAGVAYVECTKPWFVGPLASFRALLDTLWSGAKRVVGVVLDVGEAVLEVPDTIATAWTIAKWIAVLGGAYVIYEYRDDIASLVR